MKSSIRQLPQSFAKLFGFFIVALVISTSTCRFNSVKAQDGEGDGDLTVKTKWCNRDYYEQTYGVNWHIYWAAHMCWLYTGEQEPLVIVTTGDPEPKPSKPEKSKGPRMFAVRGR